MSCHKFCIIFWRCLLLPFKLVAFFFFWLTLNLLPCLKFLPCDLCLRMGFGSADQRIHPMLGHTRPRYNFGIGALISISRQMIAFACGAPLMAGDVCVDFDLYDLRNNEVFELQVTLTDGSDDGTDRDTPSSTTTAKSNSKDLSLAPCMDNEALQKSRIKVFAFGSATAPGFMLQSGRFINLASMYSRIANFGWVYIEETHPTDGFWRLSDNVKIAQHVELEDRVAAAKILHDSFFNMEFIDLDLGMSSALSGMGFYVDDMADTASKLFNAFPYRCVCIKDDRVAVVTGVGQLGFDLDPIENFLHAEFGKLKHRLSQSESDGIVPFALDIVR